MADDLDELPRLSRRTELLDGSLVFASPRSIFHARTIRLLDHALFEQAPEESDVYCSFTATLDTRNRSEPDALVARAGADAGSRGTRFLPRNVPFPVDIDLTAVDRRR